MVMPNQSYALSRAELVHTLTPYSRWTTADGLADGSTIVDSNLILSDDFLTNKSIIILSGPSMFEDALITGFDPVTGTLTLSPTFNNQILAGTLYRVVNFATGGSIANILNAHVVGRGTFTLSDLVQPEDNTRAEGGNHWRGCLLMPIEGVDAFQPRLIVAYTGAGGIFDLDPGNPFNALPGLVHYLILSHQEQFMPVANATDNRIPADGIGNKASTAIYAKTATADIFRYLKGLMDSGIAVGGAVADAGPGVDQFDTNLTEATNDHYNGGLLMFVDGVDAGQAHVIDDYVGGTKNVSFHANDWFTDIPGNGDHFVIIPSPALRIMTGLITWDIFHEQNDTAFNVNASNAGLTDIFHLALVVNHHYQVRSLRLKCDDPIAETVTVSLFELVNDGLVVVDTFAITHANYATYFSLMDMFGLPHLAGDELRVTVTSTGAANVAVTGQYSQAITG